MKTKLLRYYLYFLFAGCGFFSMESNIQAQSNRINYGSTVGINALSTISYEVYNGDKVLPASSYSNKNGYMANVFVRFNLNRIYLQPEIAWNYYRRNYSFSLPAGNGGDYSQSVSFDINSDAINTSFLIGYKLVNDFPFLFSAFIGTSYIGTYRTKYLMNNNTTYSDNGFFFNYTGIAGFSISISKIRFDLRYELNRPNTDLHFNKIPDIPDSYRSIQIKKNENVLSFSCGIML